jgi:hypothetical protein
MVGGTAVKPFDVCVTCSKKLLFFLHNPPFSAALTPLQRSFELLSIFSLQLKLPPPETEDMSDMAKPQPHFLQDKNIVVAGAGISGLSFAISLHKLWPSISAHPVPQITLYERDPCAIPHDREGYSLSLRSDRHSAGIQTLQKMGMLDWLLNVAIASLGGEEDAKGVDASK